MKVIETKIPGVLIVETDVFGDHRGYFTETYSKPKYEKLGITVDFVQDNMSFSAQKGTLRGLHWQNPPYAQSKLVSCTKGTVIDVIKKANLTFDHYYTCGPEPMLDALALNYPENGQLSFEARMGCGFGACMGCSCKVKTKPYKRICVEGPILLSEEVIVNG